LLLQKVLDGVIVMRADGTVADWNRCATKIFGWSREEALGRSMNDLIVPPQHREAHAEGLKRYLATGEAHVIDTRIEITALDRSGREFPVELSITEGELSGERVFIGFLRDISDRKSAERALSESEARLSATYNHALVGIAEVDEAGRFLRTNEQFSAITGFTAGELQDKTLFEITHPEDLDEDLDLFRRQWAGEFENYVREKRYVRKDGVPVWIELEASIVRDGAGASSFGVRIVRDITERKDAEERQRLLVGELNHRVKNTLAIVQALAFQTFSATKSREEEQAAFSARLSALAAAHAMLTQESWQSVQLLEIAKRAVEACGAPHEQLDLQGPDLLIPPQTAVSLAMALHELCTNALKYGAFSVPAGRVTVRWQVEDGRLSFSWKETGGPRVEAPQRPGFGLRMIERGLARELHGHVELSFEPSGFVCLIDAPVGSGQMPLRP
jgi:PAS domain S-box-containing protein